MSLACGDNTPNASASDGASGDACFPGHEGCECAEDGVCLAGLVCVADRCESTDPTSVPTGTGTDGATAGSASASESASGGMPTEGASESGATATDTTPATATDTTQSTATDTTQGTATDTTQGTATDTTQGTDSDTGPGTDTGVGPDSTTSTTTNPGTTQGDTEDTTGGAACGDGVAEGQEACDGADLKGASCIGLGFEAGALGCTAACVLDTTNCTNSVACGDGMPAGLSFKPAAMVAERYATSLNRGDLNEDGHLDLVAANPTNGIMIWFGDGNTLAGNADKTHPTLTHGARLVVDVDKDGHLDVVGDKAFKDVYVSYGDGDGNLVAGEVYDTFMQLRWVALGDLDEDGWYEMAAGFAGFTDVVTVRRGQFGGLFGPAVAYDAPFETWLGGFADMDADGDLDVWSVTSQGTYLHYRGDGAGGLELMPMQPAMNSGAPRCGLVGQFNGDAYPDLAVGRYNTDAALHVRLGGAAGLGAMLYKYPADGDFPVAIEAGHFDCDEFLDIAVLTDSGSALDVFRGDGTGLFYDGQDLGPGLSGRHLTAGDFNEDGVDDLVSAHYYAEEEAIKIFLSDP